ncbi:phosphotriesterase-related protein [Granulicatella sp. zg-ZJ]|uniref:phosphotriesterase family protein n=1 Tax=unclassified Granulicatella TaxID=2630493 RepID=UPI0013C08950|nr:MULTISPECIES: phosphotriesterase-related protein [unclassified Granulicatella]MBS4750047.1 phosphotriesterase-related protein [Carnobacteriaceae bacterium zg-ZUI78]NEW62652.1 phosphotriesterase-related protein [Granulicatella sp. zg-ZJ]NEW65797.1 phosphotriesterase-related protein [Granulicatella sp. zg-84]QMI86303.1 phosphotriesterase-related protein [Carnobacteriaceae bacterium zg-84]
MTWIDGITYMHEHTTIDLSRLKGIDDTNLNCFDETVQEFKGLYERGVRNIVDVTNLDMKRNPVYVQKVAELTQINVIQATGFYQDKFLPDFVTDASVKQLADFMIKEITQGIADTTIKAQIIGEIGTSKNLMTDRERKVFEASVIAHKETGVPITTHTTLGTYGHEQIAFFKKQKTDLEKIVIGHVDLTGNAEYVLYMLDQGVYVEFDTVGKENYQPDLTRINMLKEIEKRGYIDKVFLSMDITRKSHLTYQGGMGYAYLLDTFVPMALENGVSETFIRKMLVDNPKTFMKGSKS